jgi:hypothetical protein
LGSERVNRRCVNAKWTYATAVALDACTVDRQNPVSLAYVLWHKPCVRRLVARAPGGSREVETMMSDGSETPQRQAIRGRQSVPGSQLQASRPLFCFPLDRLAAN